MKVAWMSCATLVLCLFAFATEAAEIHRIEVGNRISENLPEVPSSLSQRLQRYENARSATPGGWLADGSGLLISTRFANTAQVHRVAAPGAAREQLTFHDEPVRFVAANPRRNGFVYGKDTGGSEFWQLYWFDLDTREVKLLTDGKSRNQGPLWSHDGTRLAYSSTARNGKDTDVWVLDLASGKARPVVTDGGAWFASDFSPDGKQLLAIRYVSINESHPAVVDLESGKLRRLDDRDRKASFGAFRFAKDGKGAWYTSDESGDFSELRYHDFASDRIESVSAGIPWDVEEFTLSEDGTRLAFVTNEGGFGVPHLLDTATCKELALPELPRGIVFSPQFSPDGTQLAFALNSATSPSDVYAIDLADHRVERWTHSEVGGLDAGRFTQPRLIEYPTFDRVDGKPRTIPAFYYEPEGDGPFPVVISIHGGPESQARPRFSTNTEFLVAELGVAVLVPNVRGSSGYGKRYVALDNGFQREDSVRDIGALLDWIGTQPKLDAKRVGVYGGSYGGYMVLASMARYNDRLRAGVDVVGISNFVTFLENTQEYRRDLRRAEYGDERDPAMRAHLAKISPTANAKNITIPLFVAQGANDPRVPASEAEQILASVRGNGNDDVWYLLYKDEGHGFRKKDNSDHFRAAMMRFWQEHLIGAEAT